jgi:hypothetical protein
MTTKIRSYTHAAYTTPLLNDTIGARFEQVAASRPDRKAIVVCDWFAT